MFSNAKNTLYDNLCQNITDSPGIQVTPTEESIVIEGHRATLHCNTTANPPAKILWKKDGLDIPHSGGTVTFNAIHRNNAGLYTCEATNIMKPTEGSEQTVKTSQSLIVIIHCKYLT
jgi:hypothetical protein